MNKRVYYSYISILKNLARYLPSRIVIILNSFFIIPVFAHFLSAKQVSIYLVCLHILNFICTCSYDWVSKAVLRFHDKYLLENRIQEFFSTTFWISVFMYIVILLSFFLGRDYIISHFSIYNYTLSLVIFLVIPCGLRQVLYSLLRIKNYYKLYTFSIIIYQVLLVAIFLMLVNNLPYASSIILSMIAAISIIDVYITCQLNLQYRITSVFDCRIACLILKYSIPLVIANACYWSIFHVPMLLFQNFEQYLNTAVIGIAKTFSSNIISPIANLFIFVSFPVIMSAFEQNKDVKPYITNLVRIYLFILIPIVSCTCFFSKDLLSFILPAKYEMVSKILPIMVFSVFSHELMKIINLKYHVRVTTYIELIPGILVTILAIAGYFWGVNQNSSLMFLTCIMVVSDIFLLLINLFIKFQNFNFIKSRELMKTIIPLLFISGITFGIVNLIQIRQLPIIVIFKIILFLVLSYTFGYIMRRRILK